MPRVAIVLLLLAYVNFAQTLSVGGGPTATSSISIGQPETCTYYISPTGSDNNWGTVAAPWQHLQKAFETLSAGQTACLRAGIYEPVGTYNSPSYRHTFARAGAPRKPIVIRNYPGETATVHGEVVIKGSHLKLLGSPPPGGLVFEGPLGPDASGVKGKGDAQIWLNKCSNVVLDHVEIRNNDYHAGLFASEVDDVQVLGCYIHDNGRFGLETDPFDGSHPWNVDQGIYWAASSGTNRIANCLLEHNRAYNLQLFTGSGTITGLTMVENTIVKAMNGGVIIAKGADGNLFANNIVAMNSREIKTKQIRLAYDARNNTLDKNIAWHSTIPLQGVDTSTLEGSGNIIRNLMLVDPLFVSFAGGDYRLLPSSPAINSSLSGYVEVTDRDGVKRDSRPSLGAYEYTFPPSALRVLGP
jgi:hypothetical protein